MQGLIAGDGGPFPSFNDSQMPPSSARDRVQSIKTEFAGSRSPNKNSGMSPRSPLSPRSPGESSAESSEKNGPRKAATENGHGGAALKMRVDNGNGSEYAPAANSPPGGDASMGEEEEDLNVQLLRGSSGVSPGVAAFFSRDDAHALVLQRLQEDLDDAQEASEELNWGGRDASAFESVSIQEKNQARKDVNPHVEVSKKPHEVAPSSRLGKPVVQRSENQKQPQRTPESKRHSLPESKRPSPQGNRRQSLQDSKPDLGQEIKRQQAAEGINQNGDVPASNKRSQAEERAKGKMKDRPVGTAPSSLRIAPGSQTRVFPDSSSGRMALDTPSNPAPGASSARLASPSPLRPVKLNPAEKLPDFLFKAPAGKAIPQFVDSSKLSPKSSEQSFASSKLTRRKIFPNSPDNDKVQRKVKEFFQKRKATFGFGSSKSSGKLRGSENQAALDEIERMGLNNPDLGPFLLKLAKSAISSGDNPYKALDFALRAAQSFERTATERPSLDLVLSLHILAAIYCSLGQFEQAIPVLEHSVTVPDLEEGGLEHALAAFAAHMQLGDTYALLGKSEGALASYHSGLEIQKRVLGEMDPRVGETCRYIAEAHVQAMQLNKAEVLCQHALDIHREHSPPASVEEATDRRLMGLICNGKGEYESALEHLVLASMALMSNGQEIEVAAVDTTIGDTYVALGRFDEAVFAYQKALTVFKAAKGENHASVASVLVSLAELYLKTGKLRESKTYCESALRIYGKQGTVHPLDEIANGLTQIAMVYETLNEHGQALPLLQTALRILEAIPGQQSAAAGVETQIGVLYYVMGNFWDAYSAFRDAVSKLRAGGDKNSSFLGIVLNQMGLACVQLFQIEEAAEVFAEARGILEQAYGPHHPETLAVYSNLSGAYDALGRLEDAISLLEYVVALREEKLGTASAEVDDERKRLAELLRQAGRSRAQRPNNSLILLMQSNAKYANTSGKQSSSQGNAEVAAAH